MINLTDTPTIESIRLAKDSTPKKIIVRGKVSSIINFVAEKVEYESLYAVQNLAKFAQRIGKRVDSLIEDKIGKEANIPDFCEPYPIEQIMVLALAYPFTKKTTILEIADHYQISKRQAIRVQKEIEHGFPSFPAGKRIWEVYNDIKEENSRDE